MEVAFCGVPPIKLDWTTKSTDCAADNRPVPSSLAHLCALFSFRTSMGPQTLHLRAVARCPRLEKRLVLENFLLMFEIRDRRIL